ncbi:MAG: apolipoprotein N-acyltransferase, partial [Pseudomonadota bacterium]
NAAQHLKWDPAHMPTFWQRMMAATAAPGAPDVVIWPEVAVSFLYASAPEAEAAMAKAAAGAPVIYGTRRWPETGGWRNTLAVTGSRDFYDKVHLVPFGEYMPFAEVVAELGIFGLAAEQRGGYVPGTVRAPLSVRGLPAFLPLICYEAVFPGGVRAARGEAAWIVHLTNDAWFGSWSGPDQHLAQARFRAVEQGLPVARAANTGISAMIAPDGRVVAALPLNTHGHVDAALPAPRPATPYALWGELPFLGLLIAGFALALVLSRRGA